MNVHTRVTIPEYYSDISLENSLGNIYTSSKASSEIAEQRVVDLFAAYRVAKEKCESSQAKEQARTLHQLQAYVGKCLFCDEAKELHTVCFPFSIPSIDWLQEYETVIVYGAGAIGQSYYQQLQKFPHITVSHVIDQNGDQALPLQGGKRVETPEILLDTTAYEVIFIAIADEETAMKMKHDLHTMYHVPHEKMVWAKPKSTREMIMELLPY